MKLRKNEMKLRKNEMKLRRNEMKLRKNFSFPTWRIKNSHVEVRHFGLLSRGDTLFIAVR